MLRLLCRSAIVFVALGALRIHAAPFVNLNFEQAMVPPGTPPGTVPASLAFPGWAARLNNTVLSNVYYNYGGIGEPQVVLYDDPLVPGLGNVPIFEGRFGAILIPSPSGSFSPSLSQFGDIPVDAQSIRLLADGDRGSPTVLLNGAVIPMVRLSGGPFPGDVAVFGGDVTQFAGSTVELRLSRQLGISAFDNVTFSSLPIPETSTLVYSVLGLLLRRRCRATVK